MCQIVHAVPACWLGHCYSILPLLVHFKTVIVFLWVGIRSSRWDQVPKASWSHHRHCHKHDFCWYSSP